jgi:hypothetical protein
MLTATTMESSTKNKAYATTTYVRWAKARLRLLGVDQPELAKDIENGVVDQQRGLCLLAEDMRR